MTYIVTKKKLQIRTSNFETFLKHPRKHRSRPLNATVCADYPRPLSRGYFPGIIIFCLSSKVAGFGGFEFRWELRYKCPSYRSLDEIFIRYLVIISQYFVHCRNNVHGVPNFQYVQTLKPAPDLSPQYTNEVVLFSSSIPAFAIKNTLEFASAAAAAIG